MIEGVLIYSWSWLAWLLSGTDASQSVIFSCDHPSCQLIQATKANNFPLSYTKELYVMQQNVDVHITWWSKQKIKC